MTGYLFHLANRRPKAFARLLEKMVPLQLSGSVQGVVEQVTIVTVPAGNFLSKDVPPTDSWTYTMLPSFCVLQSVAKRCATSLFSAFAYLADALAFAC